MAQSANDSISDVSFEDIDVSIIQQVKQAIQRVAATQHDASQSEDEGAVLLLPQGANSTALSLEELEEQREQCVSQIITLEAEIELLEDELRRKEGHVNDVSDEDIERAIVSLAAIRRGETQSEGESSSAASTSLSGNHDNNSSGNRDLVLGSVQSDNRDIKHLKSQIKMNEAFNGIIFTSVDWEVTHTDDNGLLRKYTHIGSASGFSFNVQFVVREENEDERGEPARAKIIFLRAEVDPDLRKGIQPFLSRLSRDCDVMNFYQTFGQYCLLVLERKETFDKAKLAHGKRVNLGKEPLGSRLQFRVSKGSSLVVTWNISVSHVGVVDCSLSLQVKMPLDASEEQQEAFGHLPQLLQKMVQVNEHSEALLKFLMLFSPKAT